MSVLVVGGAGFIGRRLIPLLLARGEDVVCFDINVARPLAFGEGVKLVRGDVTQFDDVMVAVTEAKPERLINLSYHIGSDLPPHIATKLNVVGMDNCFEAARLAGVRHTVYASSLAVNGAQKHFGERAVTEDDFRHGDVQYAVCKIFNEWQAKDYRDKYGMTITGVRPANVTGPDKVMGSVDHVNCIVQPARGKSVTFPYRDAMRCPIHVDDTAEVFARVLMAEKPKHGIYNSGGHAISLGDLAAMVREFLPDADIRFDKDTGGREISGNFLIDNTRLVEEFGVQYAPFRSRVRDIINDIRRDEGRPAIP
jgi:nucleoside-diphosphate-sugar epimerase